MTFHIGDSVEVLYNGLWCEGTVVSEPKILLANKFYEVQFVYRPEGEAPESVIQTFGQPEIRFRG